MLRGILRECGVGDETLTRKVQRLVCLHEGGGDLRSDLLKEADSRSCFDVNPPPPGIGLCSRRHKWEGMDP